MNFNRPSLVNVAALLFTLVAIVPCVSADELSAPVSVKALDNSPLVTVTQGGNVGIGTTNPSAQLEVSNSAAVLPRGIVSSQHNDGGHGAQVIFKKSRGTEAAPKPLVYPNEVNEGDYVGGITAMPWNNTGYERSAMLSFRLDKTPYEQAGTPGFLLNPTAIVFVTGSSTTTLKEAVRIPSDGGIRISPRTDRPACNASSRGTIFISTENDDSDTVLVCLKKGTDYKWRTIVSSGNSSEHIAGNTQHVELAN